MLKKDTAKILKIISRIYPNSYKGTGYKEMQETVDIWFSILRDYSFDEVQKSLYEFTSDNTSAFAPVPGQLIEIIKKNRRVERMGLNEQKVFEEIRNRKLLSDKLN